MKSQIHKIISLIIHAFQINRSSFIIHCFLNCRDWVALLLLANVKLESGAPEQVSWVAPRVIATLAGLPFAAVLVRRRWHRLATVFARRLLVRSLRRVDRAGVVVECGGALAKEKIIAGQSEKELTILIGCRPSALRTPPCAACFPVPAWRYWRSWTGASWRDSFLLWSWQISTDLLRLNIVAAGRHYFSTNFWWLRSSADWDSSQYAECSGLLQRDQALIGALWRLSGFPQVSPPLGSTGARLAMLPTHRTLVLASKWRSSEFKIII